MEKELIHKSIFECVKFTLFDNEGKSRDCADRLREEFLIEFNKKIHHFWIDVTNLYIINSSFVGVIGFIYQTIKGLGEIVIFGANDNIRNVLEISGLLKLPNLEITIKKEISESQTNSKNL